MKILVIQGPLFSEGISGDSPPKGQQRGTVGHITAWDSSTSMRQTLDGWVHSIDRVVIATWKSEQPKALALQEEFQNIVPTFLAFADELYSQAVSARIMTKREYAAVRQAATTLAGIIEATPNASDYIFKVRTDQYVPNFVSSAIDIWSTHGDNLLLVPRIVPQQPNHFSDFYYAGRADLLAEFCRVQLERTPMAPDTHRSQFGAAVYANAKVLGRSLPIKKFLLLFPGVFGVSGQKRRRALSAIAWTTLSPLDSSIWKGTVWRGVAFGKEREGMASVFREEWAGSLMEPLPLFLPAAQNVMRWLRFTLRRGFMFALLNQFLEDALLRLGSCVGSIRKLRIGKH